LLNSDKFQEWITENKQILFCLSILKVGKTIIISIIIDDLCTKFQNDADIGIVYLYCNFRRQHEQTPADLLASLLKQLVQEQSIPESMTCLYERHKGKRTRPSFNEISKALHSVMANHSKTFITIDALDKCEISDRDRKKFLLEIFNLRIKIGTNLFAIIQFIPKITKKFERNILLKIRASKEDVRKYLDNHILRLPLFVSRSLDLQKEIKTEIIKIVNSKYASSHTIIIDQIQLTFFQISSRTALSELANRKEIAKNY
jgi:hypothetical protein